MIHFDARSSLLCNELDTRFDQLLAGMKQHVLKLPLRSERQKCALWIKKLCEMPVPAVSGRKTRNSYTELLLSMLQRGRMSDPFTDRPPLGPLDPLESLQQSKSHTPYWIAHELDDDTCGTNGPSASPASVMPSSRRSIFTRSATYVRGSPSGHLNHGLWANDGRKLSSRVSSDLCERLGIQPRERPASSLDISSSRSPRSNTKPMKERLVSPNQSLASVDDIDVGTKKADNHFISFIPALKSDRLFAVGNSDAEKGPINRDHTSGRRTVGLHDAADSTNENHQRTDHPHKPCSKHEFDMKLKIMEAKFQEEKLSMQQKHDAEIQKVLQRKNNELAEMKARLDRNVKDAEAYSASLEVKIQNLERDHGDTVGERDFQLADLRASLDRSEEKARKKFDEKLQEAQAEFEREKYAMQKQHTKNIQEILDDTNGRLQRMEAQYALQINNTTSVIGELEQRVQQVISDAANTHAAKENLEKGKVELETEIVRLREQRDAIANRHKKLEVEKANASREHEHNVAKLRQKYEEAMEYIRHEHSAQLATASEKTESQQAFINGLRASLKESDEQRLRQLKDLADATHKERTSQESLRDKQVKTLKSEMQLIKQDLTNKNKKLQQALQEKEEEIMKLRTSKDEVSEQADRAVADFKAQVEKNQKRVYNDMKLNMEKIELDLNKSRQIREKQSKEFSRSLAEERKVHDKNIAEVKRESQSELKKLTEEHRVEVNRLRKNAEEQKRILCENFEDDRLKKESQYLDKLERNAQAMGQLEEQVNRLKEDLRASHQTRKQQLVELGLERDEEKQALIREQEQQLSKIQSAAEQQRLTVQKIHSLQIESLLKKTNARLKEMENECSDKILHYTNTIQKLQISEEESKNEILKRKELFEEKIADVRNQHEQERSRLRRKYSSSITSLRHDLECQRNLMKSTENKLVQQTIQQEEKVTKLKLESEQKLNDLLPVAVRQDYEETISSLKSQISTLQETVDVLKDELGASNKKN